MIDWKSVKIKPETRRVIVCIKKPRMSLAARFSDGKFINIYDSNEILDVTHWMQFPEPPEIED